MAITGSKGCGALHSAMVLAVWMLWGRGPRLAGTSQWEALNAFLRASRSGKVL